jgi:hypothetical protein
MVVSSRWFAEWAIPQASIGKANDPPVRRQTAIAILPTEREYPKREKKASSHGLIANAPAQHLALVADGWRPAQPTMPPLVTFFTRTISPNPRPLRVRQLTPNQARLYPGASLHHIRGSMGIP